MAGTDIVRPFLFAFRVALWISAVITMGLTAWTVSHLKGYRAIFTLVIAVITTVFYIPSLFTACMHRNVGYMIPLDIVFYALWLAAFIFVAQTNQALNFDGGECSLFVWDLSRGCAMRNGIEAFTFLAFFWTFAGLCLEILNLYFRSRQSVAVPATALSKEHQPAASVSNGQGTTTEMATAPNTEV